MEAKKQVCLLRQLCFFDTNKKVNPGILYYSQTCSNTYHISHSKMVIVKVIVTGDYYPSYTGERNTANQRHGQGTLTDRKHVDNPDGQTQSGTWVNGMMHGHGTWVNHHPEHGSIYVGEWRNGKKHGHGTETKNGNTYTGNWVDGVMQGEGTMTRANGRVFTGCWHYNRMGKGTLTWPDGREFTGNWIDEHTSIPESLLEDKQVTMKSPSGCVYTGTMHYRKMKGEGTFVWPSGATHTGEWSFGKLANKSQWKSIAIRDIYEMDFYYTMTNKQFDIVSEILREPADRLKERADRLNSRYFLVAMRMRQEKAYIESSKAKQKSSEEEQQM